MARATSAVARRKHRKEILSHTKGFQWGRKNKERAAHEALLHAAQHSFDHRKDKKGDFRRLWTVRINAALRALGLGSYSKTIGLLKTKNIELDRKTLATLAKDKPEIFERAMKQAQ